MALCESQLDSALPQIRDDSSERDPETMSAATASPDTSQDKKPSPADLFALNQGGLPLTVDYRSPVSHFIPPAVELYNATRNKQDTVSTDASDSPTPVKRKRGRPRVDKTSPEYLAKSAARRRAREMAAMMNSSTESGEKRKRGRPRVDKTSPEYLARRRARELEALEKKAKRQYKRRATGDSAASSSGETTPRVKRKYTKRALSAGGAGPGRPRKSDSLTPTGDRVKGKRGRPRKADLMQADGARSIQSGQIRVRNNLMPINTEPISLDSDDEPDLGSPSAASDSLSLDENLRALRHLHEKYANLDRDAEYAAQLLPATCRQREQREQRHDTSAMADRVEKLEDSSNSDSDSSSSGSGSGSSCSSSSSSSGSSSSSSSESEGEGEGEEPDGGGQGEHVANNHNNVRSASGSPRRSSDSDSDSDSDPERESRSMKDEEGPPAGRTARSPTHSISESDNESPDKSFQCHVCRKWYSTSVTLKIHRRSHLNRGGGGGGGGGGGSRSRSRPSTRYECDCCSETFSRREKLWEHKAAVHRGAMTVRCSVCRRCFEDEAELAAHDRAHTCDERAGRCSVCAAVFSSFSALQRHRSAVHGVPAAAGGGGGAGGVGGGGAGGAHSHTCPQCGKGFGHAHSLSRHLQNHARQLYRCVVCKASFMKAEQLAQHLNSHLANYKRLKP